MKTWSCDKHQTTIEAGEFCPDCMEAFTNRRDPDTMTGEERAAEFRWWGSILTIPFDNIHQRIQELVGRPVWTHEMAGEAAVEVLIEESRTREHPTVDEVLGKLPGGKPIIFVQTD